jgi:hypothetical protein
MVCDPWRVRCTVCGGNTAINEVITRTVRLETDRLARPNSAPRGVRRSGSSSSGDGAASGAKPSLQVAVLWSPREHATSSPIAYNVVF